MEKGNKKKSVDRGRGRGRRKSRGRSVINCFNPMANARDQQPKGREIQFSSLLELLIHCGWEDLAEPLSWEQLAS